MSPPPHHSLCVTFTSTTTSPTCGFVLSPVPTASSLQLAPCSRRGQLRVSTACWAQPQQQPPQQARPGSVSADGKAQKASFYKRPSKAIEMGGGFFIPGLEGYKLRLATAVLVLVLLALNRFPGYAPPISQSTSEIIGAGAAVILLAQSLIEKLITDSGSAPEEDDDSDDGRVSTSSTGSGSGGSSRVGGVEEECFGLVARDPQLEDDVRWAGYALDENLGCPSVAVLHGEQGLVYYRRRSSKDATSSSSLELATALLQTLPVGTRRAIGMGDALAALGGVAGNSGAQLAQVLGMAKAEGAVVVRIGERGLLLVAPPVGGIMRDQAVWVERAAALLEGSGRGSERF
ncbi:hypothetical protein VYU27_006057 [Nannochloropsis oceanica]